MKDLKETVPAINVSKEFLKDFKDYCAWMDFDQEETDDLRDCIRADFNQSGKWIQKQMAVKRWAEEKWGHMPDMLEIKKALVSIGYVAEDSDMFIKLGYMILLELCYDIL